MKLGQRIKEARLQKQLTQKDVVGEFMTRNMLSKIENGSATPSVKTLEYLAGALDMPVSYLVGEDDGAAAFDPEQLAAIRELTERLLSEPAPIPDGLTRAIALCIKARALMTRQDTAAALELLDSLPFSRFNESGAQLVFQTLEACCTQQGDYKMAYEYAVRSRELAQDKQRA